MSKIVNIEGMMCQNCAKHVKKALEALGVKVEVDLAGKKAMVEGDVDNAAIESAVTEAGYKVVGIE